MHVCRLYRIRFKRFVMARHLVTIFVVNLEGFVWFSAIRLCKLERQRDTRGDMISPVC